jgi:F0F1-type ATP synthase assembly protein I
VGNVGPAARLLGIGTYVAVCIVLGTLGGRWLDSQFETEPLLTVIGLFLGLALAIYGAVQQLFEVLHEIDARRKEGKKLP